MYKSIQRQTSWLMWVTMRDEPYSCNCRSMQRYRSIGNMGGGNIAAMADAGQSQSGYPVRGRGESVG